MVYSPVIDDVYPLGDDSPVRMWTINPSRGVRTWRILAQVITFDFCCVPYIACIAHVVTGVLSGEVGICYTCVCIVCA